MGLAPSVPYGKWTQIEEYCDIDRHRGPLGSGAIGTVWRAHLNQLGGGVVALKSQDKMQMQELGIPQSQIESEVELMNECFGRQWFVQLRDFIQDASHFYLVMEYCDCGTLASAVKEGKEMGDDQVKQFTKQLLEGVTFLHSKGICHRDIKPQNTMLAHTRAPFGELRIAVKIGDFGLAVRIQLGVFLRDKVGTPAFMAPEMHLLPRWSAGYDHRVDLWAVGAVMVFLLAHEYAFVDESGRIVLEELLRGDLPIWNRNVFDSLFQAKASAKKPSYYARDLVQHLLAPSPQYRIGAAVALRHEWFNKALGPRTMTEPMIARTISSADLGDAAPLLRWEDYQTIPGAQVNPGPYEGGFPGVAGWVADRIGLAAKPVPMLPHKLSAPVLPMLPHKVSVPMLPHGVSAPLLPHKVSAAMLGSPMHGSPLATGSPNLLQALFYHDM